MREKYLDFFTDLLSLGRHRVHSFQNKLYAYGVDCVLCMYSRGNLSYKQYSTGLCTVARTMLSALLSANLTVAEPPGPSIFIWGFPGSWRSIWHNLNSCGSMVADQIVVRFESGISQAYARLLVAERDVTWQGLRDGLRKKP